MYSLVTVFTHSFGRNHSNAGRTAATTAMAICHIHVAELYAAIEFQNASFILTGIRPCGHMNYSINLDERRTSGHGIGPLPQEKDRNGSPDSQQEKDAE